jgi:hypothetical protein
VFCPLDIFVVVYCVSPPTRTQASRQQDFVLFTVVSSPEQCQVHSRQSNTVFFFFLNKYCLDEEGRWRVEERRKVHYETHFSCLLRTVEELDAPKRSLPSHTFYVCSSIRSVEIPYTDLIAKTDHSEDQSASSQLIKLFTTPCQHPASNELNQIIFKKIVLSKLQTCLLTLPIFPP